MTRKRIRSSRFAIALVVALLSIASLAQAGPPLICHTIEIGQAKSLPWISHNWNLSGGETYETKNLVRDTLEILAPDTPVLVRMETLRRATLYARKDPVAAKELLARLHARATSAESSAYPDALAWFDVGYLAETYKQWLGRNLPHMTDGMLMDPNPAAGVDGYVLVKKALDVHAHSQNGDDPQMIRRCPHHPLRPPSRTPRARPESHRRRQNRSPSGSKPRQPLHWPANRDPVATPCQKLVH